MGSHKSKIPKDHARLVIAQLEALKLRSRRLTYDQIAIKLGLSNRSIAHRYVMAAMEANRAEVAEAATVVREQELLKLDEIETAVLPAALQGDLKAIDAVLRLMERRTKYLGMDAPAKSESLVVQARFMPKDERLARLAKKMEELGIKVPVAEISATVVETPAAVPSVPALTYQPSNN